MITVNAQELKDLLDRGAIVAVLNVRPASARSEGRIPGSLHVPQVALEKKVAQLLPDKEAWVAVYGADFTCETSTRAAKFLEGLGYKHVYNFSAGLKGWKDAGFGVHPIPVS